MSEDAPRYTCRRCGTEISDLCDGCSEDLLNDALDRLWQEQLKNAHHMVAIPKEEYDKLKQEGHLS